MLKNNGFHNRHSPILRAFSPLSLFSGGAPGAWYDPSDYGATGTLFQDSAGTTPVTAVEQPVGLMLDKSQGLVLGTELVTNGDFSGGTTTGWTADANAGGFPAATLSVVGGKLRVACGTGGGRVGFATQSFATIIGRTYQYRATGYTGTTGFSFRAGSTPRGFDYVDASPATGVPYSAFFTATTTTTYLTLSEGSTVEGQYAEFDNISVKELPGNHAFQATSASRPVLSARVNKLLATAALATQSVTTRATAHTLRFEGAGSVTLTGTAIGVYTAGTHSITTTAGTLTLTVLGSVTSADLRETNDGVGVPAYQAVVTSTNYATTGFLPYLKFDGVDDSLSTNSISFTSTDKMSVFAGVRKLTPTGTLSVGLELSASVDSNNGAFYFATPGGSNDYAFVSKGSTNSAANTGIAGYGAPITNVLTGLGDISGDLATLRINGTQVAQSTADQGTGNYGNYPLYIGRRGGSSLPFNGQMYSMIIVGKAVTAGELSSTETYVAAKTGVTL